MIWTTETILLANAIILIASILQMVTGITIGIIIVPLLAMISFTLVPVPVVFASMTLTILMAYKGRQYIETKNVFQICFGMLIGILISVLLFKNIHFEYLGVIFGILILISVLISLKIKHVKLGKTVNYTGGFVSGIMGALAAVGGQVLSLIFQNHPLESIKANLSFLYTIFSITMLVIFYLFDEFAYSQMLSGFYMMPGFIAGFIMAPMFTKYFNAKYTRTLVLSMATMGAIMLIIKSII